MRSCAVFGYHPRSSAAPPLGRMPWSMRLLYLLAVGILVAALPPGSHAVTAQLATLEKSQLGDRFLLQVSYEQKSSGQAFKTTRSRIVTFRRGGPALQMLDMSDTGGRAAAHVLATIPIRSETGGTLDVDLNVGFNTVSLAEDRTGEDYYGRVDRHDDERFRLVDRTVVSLAYHSATLVFEQKARTDDGQRIVVHYYLSPYHPRSDFQPFEMTSLRRFGFYETYPQWRSGRWVLYAMKFDVHEPI